MMAPEPTPTTDDRPSIADRPEAELEALVEKYVPDPEPIPDPVPDPEPVPDPVPDAPTRREMAEAIVANMPDDVLAALPEVLATDADPSLPMRDNRADHEAAALGEMLEAEREAAARAASDAANAAALAEGR